MVNTTNLGLPLMSASQSQKHLTHNDALVKLDAIVQLAVISATFTNPPVNPNEGDSYIVGSSATGAWAGKDLNIAFYESGVWQFLAPRKGWQAFNIAINSFLVWSGSAWVSPASLSGFASTAGNNTWTGTNIFTDNLFSLVDDLNSTKVAKFDLSGLTASTTSTFILPAINNAVLASTGNLNQTFIGATTFSNTFLVAAQNATLGSLATASTLSIGSGATTSGVSKTVNIGTSGLSGSTTTVNIGSAVAGALGSTIINSPTIEFPATNTAMNITGPTTLTGANTTATLQYLGLGGASATATNRLSVNSPSVLFNNAGTSSNATINKNAPANDASITLQTNFSTRGLFGLLGNDNLALKVSANGTTFYNGLEIDKSSGHVGINNTTPDTNNGLSVKGNVLFNTENASSQLTTINRQASSNDAGFVFQTNFSTRALFGNLADNNFTIKVSPDGASFIEALSIDSTTGIVSLPKGPGRLSNVIKYTANATWTRPVNCRAIMVEVVGAGGGGGGVAGVSGSNVGAGGGGGAGAFIRHYIDVTSLASAAVVVGVGGVGGANTGGTGGTGGTSSFNGAMITCPGGAGGIGQTAGSSSDFTLGGTGGTPSPLTVNLFSRGVNGEYGQRISGTAGISGRGGAGPYGGGGPNRITSGAGSAAISYGSGGSGALTLTTLAFAGGDGGPGVVIVYEYV